MPAARSSTTSSNRLVVRGVGLIQSIADIENVVVTATKGVPVFVRDIGRVQIGAAPQTGIFAIDDKTDRVEGIVLMRRGENPTEVLTGIKEAVEDLNTNRLPKGIRIEPIYDRTDLVHNTLATVTHTLIEGLIIVVAVLFLFLGSVRAALLTAITIPLSLLFAFICMHFTGIPANLLSLGALDFGIIVDGTLVMVEHIVHALDVRRREAESADPTRTGAGRRDPRHSRCGAGSGAADLFLTADHYCRLHPAVYAGTGGAAIVYPDGVHGMLRAAGVDVTRTDFHSRAGDLLLPARIEGLGQSGVGVAAGRVTPACSRSDGETLDLRCDIGLYCAGVIRPGDAPGIGISAAVG